MSDNRRHYAIFFERDGKQLWVRSRTKREAVRYARSVNGIVGMVGYASTSAWDAPTFKVSATVVADFRPVEARKASGEYVVGLS